MVDRLSILLALCAAALTALLARQAGYLPEPPVPANAPIALPMKPESPPASPAPFALPPIEAFSEVAERPLFAQGRRPPKPDSDSELKADTEPVNPTSSAAAFVLAAVIITDEEKIALLEEGPQRSVIRVREGDHLQGWTVEGIEAQSAQLVRDGESRRLTLRRFEPPPKQFSQRSRKAQIPRPARGVASSKTAKSGQRPRRVTSRSARRGTQNDERD